MRSDKANDLRSHQPGLAAALTVEKGDFYLKAFLIIALVTVTGPAFASEYDQLQKERSELNELVQKAFEKGNDRAWLRTGCPQLIKIEDRIKEITTLQGGSFLPSFGHSKCIEFGLTPQKQ